MASLSTFLVAARPAVGTAIADEGAFAGGIAVVLASALALLFLAASRPGRHRAALLGLAAGLSHGAVAPLLKQVVGQAHLGLLVPLQHWDLYAVVAIGSAAFVLIQIMYQAGRLGASLPPMTIIDPIVAVTLGAVFFHERLAHSHLLWWCRRSPLRSWFWGWCG